MVDEEAEDERMKVSIQDGLLTFTTQTRKEMFGTDDILVYQRHGQWEDKQVQTLDVSKFVQSPAIVVRELSEEVLLSEMPSSAFTLSLDENKSAVMDMSGLRNDAEYRWRIYLKTGEYEGEKVFELLAREDGEDIEIQWVDDCLHLPFILPSSATICMEITKLPEKTVFGRILWSKLQSPA